ncbi:archease [bacterium]|nr:archease [bacterium]
MDHTADVGFRVWGKNGPELFIEAAYAMMSQIVNLETIKCVQKQVIHLEEKNLESLLHRWLREILFYFDKGLIFNQFHIEKHNLSDKKASEFYLDGYWAGEPIDLNRHEICIEIKAVTRHNFYLRANGPWWEANILFDV